MNKNARDRSKILTRGRLLDAAERALARTDFMSSTLEIARSAKIAHGTIFFHFRDRKELVNAVVRRMALRMAAILHAAYTEAPGLQDFLSAYCRLLRKNRSTLNALLAGFRRFDGDARNEIAALLSVVTYYLMEAFNKWSDNGASRAVLWQGAFIYASLFGDHMFETDFFSGGRINELIALAAGRSAGPEPGHAGGKKMCSSCGMIFRSVHEQALDDPASIYCRYCADETGKLRPRNEVTEIMTDFFKRTQGLTARAARRAAVVALSRNAAWKNEPDQPVKRR